MKLQIDTDTSTAELRHHFGVCGLSTVTVTHHRSKTIAGIFINGVNVKSGARFFHHLALMVSEAIQEKDTDDECLELIPQLRAV